MPWIRQQPRRTKGLLPYANRLTQTSKHIRFQKAHNSEKTKVVFLSTKPFKMQYYALNSIYNTIKRYIAVMIRRKRDNITKQKEAKIILFQMFANVCWPTTYKPKMRMGTGKGKVNFWVSEYRTGSKVAELFICEQPVAAIITKAIKMLFPVKIIAVPQLTLDDIRHNRQYKARKRRRRFKVLNVHSIRGKPNIRRYTSASLLAESLYKWPFIGRTLSFLHCYDQFYLDNNREE